VLSGAALPPLRYATMTAALDDAERNGAGITFVAADETEVRLSWAEIVARARRVAGALRGRGIRPGERVAIILRTGPAFVDAFFGAMLAGAVPVPLYPPLRLGQLAAYQAATARMLRAVEARMLVTDRDLRMDVGAAALSARPAPGVVIAEDLLGGTPLESWPASPEDLAMVQFSSGTTMDPRPVALAHAQLAAHLTSLLTLVAPAGRLPIGVSWLPLYHDMGLIGCLLGSMYGGSELVLLAPEVFLARPAVWLRAIARHRGTVSPAPSFAYALCTRRIRDAEIDGVDLSSWRYALDGAEQVSPETARQFAARFVSWGFDPHALVPVYGLAEATLAVTFSTPGRGLVTEQRDREIVSVGRPVPGVDIAIRDELMAPVAPGTVGRIHVRGPSVMTGYLGRPDATRTAVRNGWLDTGDLGYIDEGELYVVGRAKDVIVIRGANHDPVAIESCLTGIEGLRPGCAVAVGFTPAGAPGEELLVLAERYPGADDAGITSQISSEISARTGLRPHAVRLLAPGTLPRTSSGKLRRGEALRRHLGGALDAPRAPSRWRLGLHALRTRLALAFLTAGHARR
jgi:acyl-CoA synthetase (AMP-forming)/AMP-acid ligase II